MAKLVVGLSSGSIDKLVGLGVMLSGAAADDMEIEVYVLLTAARAFLKENEFLNDSFVEYPHLKEEMLAKMKELDVQHWADSFRQVKEFTDCKFYICSLAGKMWNGVEKDQFIDVVDDFSGIFQYIEAAQKADLHINI